MTSTINRTRWAMVAILLLASAFYLYNLNNVSFWEDESWLTIAIGDGVGDVWTFATEKGVHPPLYFYIAYFLKPFISDFEYPLRWTAGLIALIGVAFTYRFGADTVDRRVGLYMALLVTGSIFLIYLARLARQYSLFYTLSVMTFWIYWRWQARPSNRWLWFLMFAQTANFYTHYFSAFIAISISLHALLTNPKQSWRVMLAIIGSGILFLPWLPSILRQIQEGEHGSGLDYGTSQVALIIENYLGRMMNANWWLGGTLSLLGIIAFIREKRWKLGLLLVISVATLIPVILVNQMLFQWYIGRNMLYTLPMIVLLYAVGLAYLPRLFTPSSQKRKTEVDRLPPRTDTITPTPQSPQGIREGKADIPLHVPTKQKDSVGTAWMLSANTKAQTSRVLNFISLVIAAGFIIWGLYVYPLFWPGTADWRGIMEILARDARADDIFVLNGEPYSIDYYLRRFLGERVEILPMRAWWKSENPEISGRIWLIDSDEAVRFEAIAAIPDNMLMTRRLVRLPVVAEFYQRVPDEASASFGEQLALGYSNVETLTIRRGETLVLDVWWQALQMPDFNYSAAFYLMSDGWVLTQVDGNFDSGRLDAQVLPIGIWIPDMRLINIPADAPLGEYELKVTVYDWRDSTRLAIDPASSENLFTLLRVIVED